MSTYLSHFFSIGIPAMLVFACFYPYRRRALSAQGLCSSPWREAALHLFVLCIFGLAAIVLWPAYHFENSNGLWGNLVIHNNRESWTDNINLVPLRMVSYYFHAFRRGHLYFSVVMFFGNIGVFLPMGFFPGLLFRNFGAKKTFFLGLLFSLGLECCQFFLGRHCDVDDVILNVLGVMTGYWLLLLMKHLFPRFCRNFRCES